MKDKRTVIECVDELKVLIRQLVIIRKKQFFNAIRNYIVKAINVIPKRKKREACERAPSWVSYVASHSELNCSDAHILCRYVASHSELNYLGEPTPSITEDIIELANKGYNLEQILKILYSTYYIGFIEGERE